MTRALIAVGVALTLLIGGLGLAVYLSRDEDNIQVDQTLSENFTRAIALSQTRPDAPGEVRLDAIARFPWDHVLLVEAGTPAEAVSRRLGYPWTGTIGFQTGDALILLDGGKVARFMDYRGEGRFAGVRRPIDELSRARAVFRVRDLVITPKG
jgi:hypothetical protein